MGVDGGLLFVGAVAASASLATAAVLWITLRGVLRQAESMTRQSESTSRLLEETAKQATLTAEVLDDQRRQRTLDLALRFHREIQDRNTDISDLVREFNVMSVDSRVRGQVQDKAVRLLSWLDTYGVLCREGLVPDPDAVFGGWTGRLREFLVACAYHVDHTRSRLSPKGLAYTGLRWFEQHFDVDIVEESRKAQTLHPPRPEDATE